MKRFVLPLILILNAAGCASPGGTGTGPTADASSPTATATPTKTLMGPGQYEFTAPSGGQGTLTIPAEPVAEIESLRALVDGEPVTYLTGTADNREGSEAINMYGVSIFTPEGEELQYKSADTYVDELRNMLPDDAPSETYNLFIDASNKYQIFVKPLAKADFVLVGPTVPKEITGISVYPSGGFDRVEATPAGLPDKTAGPHK